MDAHQTKKSRQKCSYAFLENYLNETKKIEALEHAENCVDCLETALSFEKILFTAKRKVTDQDLKLQLSETELISRAETYLSQIKSGQSGDESIVPQSQGDQLYFFQLINYLQGSEKADKNLIKTPVYLKQYVMRQLDRDQEASKATSIVIRVKNGVKLVGNYLDEVFTVPDFAEAEAVRSVATAAEPTTAHGILQFYLQAEESKEKLLYQVVQDGPGTVMLTVKLQGFSSLPRVMNLKRENRLILSFPIKEDFAFFPQLTPGNYQVELKGKSGMVIKTVDIEILSE